MNDLLTTAEAAKLAGITPAALRKRRSTERDHPSTSRVGTAALYAAHEFVTYLGAWRDARFRA